MNGFGISMIYFYDLVGQGWNELIGLSSHADDYLYTLCFSSSWELNTCNLNRPIVLRVDVLSLYSY